MVIFLPLALPRVKIFAKLEYVFLQNNIESIIKGFIG